MYRIISEYDLWVVGMLGNMYHTLSFKNLLDRNCTVNAQVDVEVLWLYGYSDSIQIDRFSA